MLLFSVNITLNSGRILSLLPDFAISGDAHAGFSFAVSGVRITR